MYRSQKITAILCSLISMMLVGNYALAIEDGDAAKKSLRELLNKFTSLQASFEQTVTDAQGQELQTSEGVISLQKPQKLRWEVSVPEESLLIADGETIFNVDPFVEQVTLLDQSQLTNSNPLMLLVSDDNQQWQNISVEQQDDTFSVFPNNLDSSITKLTLYFSDEGVLIRLISEDQQEQSNQIVFKNMLYNKVITDASFTYSPMEGWVIDDQRSAASAQ